MSSLEGPITVGTTTRRINIRNTGSTRVEGDNDRQTKPFLPLLPSKERKQDRFSAYTRGIWRNRLD